MPIYEYECAACGKFEAMEKATDAPMSECPECGKKVERVMSASAFHLKGGGWYKTDYASNGTSKGSSSETSKSETSSTTESKSEATKSDSADKPKSLKTTGGRCGGGCGCAE